MLLTEETIKGRRMNIEKLTDVISIKFPDKNRVAAQAASRGMEVSEYIRHLVDLDYEDLRSKFVSMSALFCETQSSGNVITDLHRKPRHE